MNQRLKKQIDIARRKYKWRLWDIMKIKKEYCHGINSKPRISLVYKK